jgi:hypothetical protein
MKRGHLKKFFIIFCLVIGHMAYGAQGALAKDYLTYEDFVLLSPQQQLKVLNELQKVAIKIESEMQGYDGDLKKFSSLEERKIEFLRLWNLLVPKAYGQTTDESFNNYLDLIPPAKEKGGDSFRCVYGGWVSIAVPVHIKGESKARHLCMHPGKSKKHIELLLEKYAIKGGPYQKLSDIPSDVLKGFESARTAYEAQKKKVLALKEEYKDLENLNNCDADKWMACNPALFGDVPVCGAAGTRVRSRNTSLQCWINFQQLPEEKRLELVKNILSSNSKAQYFADLLKALNDLCICRHGMNPVYTERIFFHRTCYSLLEQSKNVLEIAQDAKSCKITVAPGNEMELSDFSKNLIQFTKDDLDKRLVDVQGKTPEEIHKEFINLFDNFSPYATKQELDYKSNDIPKECNPGLPDQTDDKKKCLVEVAQTVDETSGAVTLTPTVTATDGGKFEDKYFLKWSPEVESESTAITVTPGEETISYTVTISVEDQDEPACSQTVEIPGDKPEEPVEPVEPGEPTCEVTLEPKEENDKYVVNASVVYKDADGNEVTDGLSKLWEFGGVESSAAEAFMAERKEEEQTLLFKVKKDNEYLSECEKSFTIPKKEEEPKPEPKNCAVEAKITDDGETEATAEATIIVDGEAAEGFDIKWYTESPTTEKNPLSGTEETKMPDAKASGASATFAKGTSEYSVAIQAKKGEASCTGKVTIPAKKKKDDRVYGKPRQGFQPRQVPKVYSPYGGGNMRGKQ